MTTVIIDSTFIDKIYQGFRELTLKIREPGQQDVEKEIIPGIVLCREFIGGEESSFSRYKLNRFNLGLNNSHFKDEEHQTKHIIARQLGIHICDLSGDNVRLRELLDGITLTTLLSLPMGVDVKFTRDSDSVVMMISETAAPHHSLYAFEEAVNQNRSIDPALLRDTNDLLTVIYNVVGDFIMADLSPIEFSFSTDL